MSGARIAAGIAGAGGALAGLTPALAQPLIRRETPPAEGGGSMIDWLPGPLVDLIGQVASWQIALGRTINREIAGLNQDGGWAALTGLVLIGLVYGVLHAVGPGHGKAIVGAYVIGRRTPLLSALSASYLIAATQALTAIAVIGVLVYLVGLSGGAAEQNSLWLEAASYAAIAVLGGWMLVNVVRGRDPCCDAPDHIHHHGKAHDHRQTPRSAHRSLFALAFAAGLRPCTGALLILLFTAANGVFLFGVASVVAMGIGVGTTVGLLAVGAKGVRAGIDAVLGNGAGGVLVQRGLTFAAAGFIVLIGALAFLASLARLGY